MTEAPNARASRVGRDVICSSCGSTDMVPILYGLPDLTMQDNAEAGESVFGGCLRDDAKAWYCRGCGSDSQDHLRPEQFAVWSRDATDEEIAAWVSQSAEVAEGEGTR